MLKNAPESQSVNSPHPVPERLHTVIEAQRGWISINLREIWFYRELLYFLTWRDVVVRYKQTVLGTAWAIVQPLVTTVVFTVVFGYFVGLDKHVGDIPYPVFVLAGLLPWNLFSGALAGASTSVLNSSGIITKVYFPRLLIPIASIGVNLVNFFVSFIMLVGVMLYFGRVPGAAILLIPLVVILVALASLALGIGLSAIMVIYRDVRHIAPFLVQILLYLTPVIYPVTIIPTKYQWLLALNPMTGLVDAFRFCLYGAPVSFSSLIISSVLIVLGLMASIMVFRRAETRFADII